MTTIHVVLIDASTQTVIGEADLPPDQLPESFAVPTTIDLGGAPWSVEHAEPVSRLEYVATGALRLTLRKIEHVDPRTILFSVPTLENALPPLHAGDLGDATWMRDDDWRQRELIAPAFDAAITAELEAIRAIHEHERRGAGFARLHVRERLPHPLDGVPLPLAEVAHALAAPRRALAVGEALVLGGFSFPIGDGYVYGRASDGVVVELGLAPGTDVEPLAPLIAAHGLVLVDWCRATRDP